jgi:arylsulfatase A-like enzyme
VPADRIIDGKDLRPLLANPQRAGSPHEALYYYQRDALLAVRRGDFKLILAAGPNAKEDKLELYDVRDDPGESKDVAAEKIELVKELSALADKAREDLGDTRKRVQGKNRRPPSTAEGGA